MNPEQIRTEDLLQLIGELFVQTRVLQKMIQTVSHSEMQEKEKQNVNGSDQPIADSASNHHSSIESRFRG